MPGLINNQASAPQSVRKIIHVDMDAFYASVEQRDNPGLRGKPVIVGGRPDGRGVVAACSYEAREYGVHSAMPSAEAARRCPDAIFVKSRFDVYRQASKQIHTVFREFSPLIEPLSLDEAYLDVTQSSLYGGRAVKIAREIKTMILQRTGLVASAGVSYNKFLAKIASDFNKPDGLYCILPENGESFVAALPIGKFYGVGAATELRMHEIGILTGADLRQWSLKDLQTQFGKSAQYYYNIARGIDNRAVRSSRIRKSIGSETTFSKNLKHREDMERHLASLCEKLFSKLEDKDLVCTTLSIKVRFPNFETLTRAHSLPSGIQTLEQATRMLPFLLDKALQDHPFAAVRLLGVSMSGLQAKAALAYQQLELKL
jgi:DNA polymerase-4